MWDVSDTLLACTKLRRKPPLTADYPNSDMGESILRFLTSARWRKSPVSGELMSSIADYIARRVSQNSSIRIFVLCGGYKQARIKSAPLPDWAEYFNIAFIMQLARRVHDIYEPGVEVVYRGDEVIMTEIGNYSVQDRLAYTNAFRTLIDFFIHSEITVRGITCRYSLTAETSALPMLLELMRAKYGACETAFLSLPKEEQQRRIMVSLRNQSWSGERDLTDLNEDERYLWAKTACIKHDAFLEADMELAGGYLKDGISISFRRGVPSALHYRSCASSAVQFWAGEGVLNRTAVGLRPWIASPSQLASAAQATFASCSVPSLEGKPFTEIRIIDIPEADASHCKSRTVAWPEQTAHRPIIEPHDT